MGKIRFFFLSCLVSQVYSGCTSLKQGDLKTVTATADADRGSLAPSIAVPYLNTVLVGLFVNVSKSVKVTITHMFTLFR